MSNSNGISFLRDAASPQIGLSAEADARIQKIARLCSRHLIEMLQNMFDGIDDSFFELANNARTNNEQNLFFEAMREIRIKRKTIENEFQQQIENQFSVDSVFGKYQQNYLQNNDQNTYDFESLSLVNKDDLEEEVAITSMATKAASNFQGPLLQFNTRIANLFGETEIKKISTPLDPKALSQAFGLVCERLEINLKEKLIVFKQFDRYVLSNLGYALDEANRFMIKAGILPDLKSTIIKQKHQPKGEASSAPFVQTDTENLNEQTENLLPQLQSLLANIRIHNPNYSGIAGSQTHTAQHYIKTEDLVNLLNTIQTTSPALHNLKPTLL
jgi:hypothetical protein